MVRNEENGRERNRGRSEIRINGRKSWRKNEADGCVCQMIWVTNNQIFAVNFVGLLFLAFSFSFGGGCCCITKKREIKVLIRALIDPRYFDGS